MISNQLSVALYESSYQQTLRLLLKSERFLKAHSNLPKNQKDSFQDLRINCEMTRITARLTQVMAWLLAQKACLAGEMDQEEACGDGFVVKSDPFCLENSLNGQEDKLPMPVRELLTDSYSLYKRILILSEQMNRSVKSFTSLSQTPRILN